MAYLFFEFWYNKSVHKFIYLFEYPCKNCSLFNLKFLTICFKLYWESLGKNFWVALYWTRHSFFLYGVKRLIFDAKGNIIGDAILYNHHIKDYSIYQTNDQLKSMIKLYFNYSQLRYSGNEIKQREYYLFNSEYMKKYKICCNYERIEDSLNANNIIVKI